jgi:MFS family permease
MPKLTDTQKPAPADTHHAAVAIFLTTVCVSLIDISVVKIALPAMKETLSLTPTSTTLVIAGPSLISGLALIPCGRLGDMYGRRRLFLVGLWLFALTGAACAGAPNTEVLVIGRLLHGLAGGLLAPQTMGMIQRLFDGRRRSQVFGYFGATAGASTAVGPLLGGILLQAFGPQLGWRLALAGTVPVALAVLAVGHRVLPNDPPRTAAHGLDLIGTALLALGMVCVLQPIMEVSSTRAQPRWWLIAVGVLSLLLFCWWERRLDSRGGEPLVPMSLLRVRSFSVGAVIATVFFAGFTSTVLVLILFLQQGLGYSALESALVTMIFTTGSTVASVISGRLAHQSGRRIVVIGGAVATIGVLVVALTAALYSTDHAVLALGVPLFVAGAGCGMLITANQTVSVREVRRADGGIAAGVYESGQRITTAIGTAIATSLFFHAAGSTHDYRLAIGYGLGAPILLLGAATLISLADALCPGTPRRKQTQSNAPAGREYELQ